MLEFIKPGYGMRCFGEYFGIFSNAYLAVFIRLYCDIMEYRRTSIQTRKKLRREFFVKVVEEEVTKLRDGERDMASFCDTKIGEDNGRSGVRRDFHGRGLCIV